MTVESSPDLPWQPELPFPPPPLPAEMPLLPARMVNEYVYCPRLAYLQWVQQEWADSADTVEGKHAHRRVDGDPGNLPAPDEVAEGERLATRSITLASERLGLVARLDLLEIQDGAVVPVDYKRGKRPHVPAGAWGPERVQLCVQAMLLEEHGYRPDHGILYFVESRERVRVPFDDALREETRLAIHGLRTVAARGHLPPPLEDSPKCPRCALVGICLPDEVNFLRRTRTTPRPLAVPVDEAMPLYVQAQYAKIGKRGDQLEIQAEDGPATTVRLNEVSQVVTFGQVSITAPCLHELMRRDIPVTWHSHGGWFLGHTVGTGHRNVELRTAQYRASFDERLCLRVARNLVAAKIRNARTLLRRNWRAEEPADEALARLRRDAERAGSAAGIAALLGIEGGAAATYFGSFDRILKKDESVAGAGCFDFARRNRRPPTDPVNALLSFAYALLTRTVTVGLTAVGLDPYRGFYHQPRYGRPALALDLMEPFRPLIADSAVITAINNGEVGPGHFVSAGGGVALTPEGRRALIAAFERRLAHEIMHPVFEYKVSYRRALDLQARLLGRFLLGEIEDLPQITPR